jgi:UDP-N-acetylglucosamine transferase subunit ALG13
MVFVTLGTQDKKFPRLLEMVNNCLQEGVITDKVIVQAGSTNYQSDKMTIYDYLSPEQMHEYLINCDYLITHGGVGSIIDGLNNQKKIIAVARLQKYGEHVNDHQLEIIKEFVKRGFIIDGTNDLKMAISKIKTFKPQKYQSNKDNFINLITNYIDNN